MPGLSLGLGVGLTTGRRRGGQSPTNPITGTGPVLAAMTDGDTLSSAVTWGSYLPPGATADRQMRADGGAWVAYNGSTVAAEGEVWQVREVVTYGVFSSTFASAAQTVAEATGPTLPVIVTPGSIEAQPLVGQAISVAEPDVAGATSITYQWYDGDPGAGGNAISGWTSASPIPTATQYALTTPIWRRATYTNASGSVTEDLVAPDVVGFVWSDDFGGLAVGANTAAILASGYQSWTKTTSFLWAGSVVSAPDGPSGKGINFSTSSSAIFGASPAAVSDFIIANPTHDYYEELYMFIHNGTGGRFAFRGRNLPGLTGNTCTAGLSTRLTSGYHQLPGVDPNNIAGVGVAGMGANVNGVYFARHRIVGAESRLKVWLASVAEPGWDVATVITHSGAIPVYGPGLVARVEGYSKTALFMSCGLNAPAPFWAGYTPPIGGVADPMTYSASGPASAASMFDSLITFNMENL